MKVEYVGISPKEDFQLFRTESFVVPYLRVEKYQKGIATIVPYYGDRLEDLIRVFLEVFDKESGFEDELKRHFCSNQSLRGIHIKKELSWKVNIGY